MGRGHRDGPAAPPCAGRRPGPVLGAEHGRRVPRYTSWEELRDALSRTHGVPELTVTDQGGFLRYRAASSHVSVLVVDDADEERGDRVGHGDVWSLDLWAPLRAGR
ncbi:hypothetical protein ACWDXD_30640 [Streptomyces sp. NPDC003314]